MTSDFSAGRKVQSDPKKMTSHGRSKMTGNFRLLSIFSTNSSSWYKVKYRVPYPANKEVESGNHFWLCHVNRHQK